MTFLTLVDDILAVLLCDLWWEFELNGGLRGSLLWPAPPIYTKRKWVGHLDEWPRWKMKILFFELLAWFIPTSNSSRWLSIINLRIVTTEQLSGDKFGCYLNYWIHINFHIWHWNWPTECSDLFILERQQHMLTLSYRTPRCTVTGLWITPQKWMLLVFTL